MPDQPETDRTPAQLLSDQYEHGDSEFDAAVDGPIQPAPEPTPRDPETGRFQKPTTDKSDAPSYWHRRAADLNFTAAEIASLPAAELKETVLAELSYRQLTARERRQPDPTEPQYRQPAPEEKPDEDDVLNPDDLAPALYKRVSRVDEHEKELKALREDVAGLRQREQFREARGAMSRLDALFAQDETIFGKGESHTLTEDSTEALRRQAVMAQLGALVQAKRQTTLEKDYARIRTALFGTTPAPKETADGPRVVDHGRNRVADWEHGGVERPTNRAPREEPKGPKRAAKAVGAWMSQNGFGGEDDPEMPE